MVTSRDVARVAGVSQATVSRVLQNSPRVRAETRERVVRALLETGYTPNILARALRTHQTGTVGVVVAKVTNPFYPQILEALGRELSQAGRRMIVWDTEGPGEESALAAIHQRLADGIIFTTVTPDSTALREALLHEAPVVLVNRGVPGIGCDQVATDNIGGGRMVAEYFVAAGRRAGIIGGTPGASTAEERERGFREGWRAHNGELPAHRKAPGDFSYRAGHAGMRALLTTADPPDAVFCVNDLTAFGALDGARALGQRVPEEIWIVGFDDIDMAAWRAFDLTTVRQPIEEMAAEAVSLLLARMDEPERPPVQRRFPSALIVRGSTARQQPPPTPRRSLSGSVQPEGQ